MMDYYNFYNEANYTNFVHNQNSYHPYAESVTFYNKRWPKKQKNIAKPPKTSAANITTITTAPTQATNTSTPAHPTNTNTNTRKLWCEKCTNFTGQRTDHKHDSTYARMREEGESCTSCLIPHSVQDDEELRIHCTSSTMAGWNDNEAHNVHHVDLIAVRGAGVEEVRNAWAADTALEKRPQHIVLSGGHLNDVINGKTAAEIFHEIRKFGELVESQNNRSTFVSMTCPFSLMIVKLSPSDNHRRKADFVNKLETIVELNKLIGVWNKRVQFYGRTNHLPPLHTFGLENDPTQGQVFPPGKAFLGELNAFVPNAWREFDWGGKLHLEDAVRKEIGRGINRYFDILLGHLRPPEEGGGTSGLGKRAKKNLKRKFKK